jgi:hypothetical protein
LRPKRVAWRLNFFAKKKAAFMFLVSGLAQGQKFPPLARRSGRPSVNSVFFWGPIRPSFVSVKTSLLEKTENA